MQFRPLPRPIRIVLKWQVIATASLTLAAALLWGKSGAISAALGGAVNIVAGGGYGWRAAQGEARKARGGFRAVFQGGGVKGPLIIARLLLGVRDFGCLLHLCFLPDLLIP